MAPTERPANVGILAMEWYAPQTYVAQTSLEEQDGCGGKYVVGLGQEAMAFVDDREDIGSKGFARLALGDDVSRARGDPPGGRLVRPGAAPGALADRGLDAALRKASAGAYDAKVAPATLIPKQIGNTHTASVFAGCCPVADGRRSRASACSSSPTAGSVATMYAFKGREADDAKFALGRRRVAGVPARLAARPAPRPTSRAPATCASSATASPATRRRAPPRPTARRPCPRGGAFARAVDDKHIPYVAPAN
ncbi:hydroxymethylglutaryl-CoA synthase [Aureococcus anophagefferens]|nr:hydroxymethylglutaryl-CoA synthase [Aureococcus anophagefferens]